MEEIVDAVPVVACEEVAETKEYVVKLLNSRADMRNAIRRRGYKVDTETWNHLKHIDGKIQEVVIHLGLVTRRSNHIQRLFAEHKEILEVYVKTIEEGYANRDWRARIENINETLSKYFCHS
jgi:negative regulator of sigma E activity